MIGLFDSFLTCNDFFHFLIFNIICTIAQSVKLNTLLFYNINRFFIVFIFPSEL